MAFGIVMTFYLKQKNIILFGAKFETKFIFDSLKNISVLVFNHWIILNA